jgi:glycine cleavage system H protein
MKREPRRFDRGLLPENALPCIWMTAGLIAYKLCDREYDCDHCPLDQALRPPSQRSPSAPSSGQRPSCPEESFPADREYHQAHLWVRRIRADRVRCGLDSFVAGLLGPIGSIVLPARDGRLHQGEICCWAGIESELVPLRAPVSGWVVRGNERLREEPNLATSRPYDRGWLFELAIGPAAAAVELLDAGLARAHAERQRRSLARKGARLLQRARSDVGPTLQDGGAPLTDLRNVLGLARWIGLVAPLLR